MAGVRDIKRRITSVKSTGQITKAMNLVSSVKLQKAKDKMSKNTVFFNRMQDVISSIATNCKGINSKYVYNKKSNNDKNLYVVLTSDRGLCGGYNANIFKMIKSELKIKDNDLFIVVGKKGRDFLKRNKMDIKEDYIGIAEKPFYEDASTIGKQIITMYNNNEINNVKLIYTSFKTVINQEVKVYDLLPINVDKLDNNSDNKKAESLMLFEPGVETVFNYVVPKYINSILFGAMLESSVSEQGSRMTAMDNATENSKDIVDDLTLKYNRARQASITKELTEIVGGANALQ